jgi:hypothetical protein
MNKGQDLTVIYGINEKNIITLILILHVVTIIGGDKILPKTELTYDISSKKRIHLLFITIVKLHSNRQDETQKTKCVFCLQCYYVVLSPLVRCTQSTLLRLFLN